MAEVKHVEPEFEGPRHHTPEQVSDYEENVLPEYRATTKHRLSVAPGGKFTNSRGVLRKGRERVDFPEDFGPFVGMKARAVASGALVELTDDEWEIANGKGTILVVLVPHPVPGTVADIGSIAKAEHYAKPEVPPGQAVRDDGKVVPTDGRPAVDGELELRRLVKQRFIGEFKSRKAINEAIEQARRAHAEQRMHKSRG